MEIALNDKPEAAEKESPLAGSLSWLLAQASHVIVTEMTRAFEEVGVSPRGHCVLSTAMSGEYTQKELAEAVGLDKTTMVVTIDELERDGLAERLPSKTDRRARIICVTAEGKKLVRKGEKIAERVHEDVLNNLPDADREVFMASLQSLVCGCLSTPAQCGKAPRRRASR